MTVMTINSKYLYILNSIFTLRGALEEVVILRCFLSFIFYFLNEIGLDNAMLGY